MRARPALFFVMFEGGARLVVDLVELGVGLEARDDADGGQNVDGDQRCQDDSGVDLQPFLVERHPEKQRNVLGNHLDLACP